MQAKPKAAMSGKSHTGCSGGQRNAYDSNTKIATPKTGMQTTPASPAKRSLFQSEVGMAIGIYAGSKTIFIVAA
jgi:hypothetical protein